MNSEEIFERVDEDGNIIGTASRGACHGNPELIHQVVHVMVTNQAGEFFLQKRSLNKDIQPGRWDTAVGGHMMPGEEPVEAAQREMLEELGCPPDTLLFAYQYIWRSPVETELVRTFTTSHEGPFTVQTEEIDEGRFWSVDEIRANLDQDLFTPNFKHEFERFQNWQENRE